MVAWLRLSGRVLQNIQPSTREEFLEGGLERANIRLFRFTKMSRPHTCNGALASYRFEMMDPASLGAMNYDQPEQDGSSRSAMAASLRGIIAMKFNTAMGVHCGKMSADTFRRDLDANWSWLDGMSLLPK